MANDLTRRRMAAILLAPAPVLGQAVSPSPTDPVEEARKQVRGAIGELGEVEIDITVQPAFVFKP